MRGSITLRPADDVPTAALVDALNLAYRNYYLPLHLTTAGFKAMVEREAVLLGASVAALDGDEIVGVALLGARPPRGWIGGVGVVPAYRRQGIARAMTERLLDQARGLGLHAVQLEVITLNKPAYALYKSLGFAEQRRLLFLSRQPPSYPPAPGPAPSGCQARPADEALNLLAKLDNVRRSWGRDPRSLMPFAARFRAIVALHPASDEPVGVCLYSHHPLQASIITLAGSSEAGAALLDSLHHAHPQAGVSYFNVPDDDPLLPQLRRAGYCERLSQFEMLHTIAE